MSQHLQGVKVLDITTVVLGPYASQILGDLGADVIKVESPQGDITRGSGPSRNSGMSAMYLNLNRNKRSIALDLKTSAGKEVLRRLIAQSDILFHNMRPEALKRLGFDAESARAINPRLIYCAAYGFADAGRYAGRAAYDDTIQAASGLASAQGAGQEPRYVNTTIADKVSGLAALWSILAALYRREKAGVGETIEVSMFEAMVSFTMAEHLSAATFEPPLGPVGYTRVLEPNRKPYRVRDGHVTIMPYSLAQWHSLFEMAGRAEMAADPRFATELAIAENFQAMQEMVDLSLQEGTKSDWMAQLDARDIAAMPVAMLDDLLVDEHLKDVGFFQLVDHPTEGLLRYPGTGVRFVDHDESIPSPAPALGQHTGQILAELGYSAREISEFVSA
jgi:crotonobetainyl-CoA:carnitine CoA-transferase CaiB-like acyl-CoA transferase